MQTTDIAIIGGGPVGLTFARALRDCGHSITIIERQEQQAIASPAFDGREIALTHASRKILEQLGLWQHIPAQEISQLKNAHIFNGPSTFALQINASIANVDELGYFAPNHLIRQAAYNALQDQALLQILCGVGVRTIKMGLHAHQLSLTDGTTLQARLVVAADSRFSEMRSMVGISTAMRNFGRTMLVCQMRHEQPHDHVSWQWFDYGQTLALLPRNGNESSVVLTLPPHEMQHMLTLDAGAFSANISQRFANRLGAMQLVGKPVTYPLIATYANRFIAHRFALIGDAAVGMHPITAHGFNFGLQSQKRLADQIWLAKRRNLDLADTQLLKTYERQHRMATWPLYQVTCQIASLYTDDRQPARLLRNAALHVAHRITPFKRAIAAHLTQA